MAKDLTHQPASLHLASIERMQAAFRSLEKDSHGGRDLVVAVYFAGLAVECMLQALALRDGAAHDARHDLPAWLKRCPSALSDTLKSVEMREHWSRLVAQWHNGIRYFSRQSLLGYMRSKQMLKGMKGDNDAKMYRAVQAFVVSADRVHKKGLSLWLRSGR